MRARLPAPLLLILSLAAAPGPRAQSSCDPAFAPAADSVRQMVSRLGLLGAGLIIQLHGRPVCEVYVGPLGPETEMPVVSAAKWLSAAAVLA
ncbi:MAG TPA: hypothetical protein VEU27_13820, partial [Gemmatimonadales bacterium]|nr:hypothetical protein [Gemmatimonadales bacterium]